MSDFDVIGTLSLEDLATDKVEGLKSSLEEVGGVASATIGPLLAIAAAAAAIVGGLDGVLESARGLEDQMAKLDNVLSNVGETANIVSGANDQAVAKMGETADAYNQKLGDIAANTAARIQEVTDKIAASNDDFMAKMADKAAQFNQQMSDMAAAHADRIQSLQESMDSVRADFEDAQQQRQEALSDTLADIDSKAADKKSTILEKMAATHSSTEYAKLQIELAALDKGTKQQEDAAKEREAKADAQAKKQEEKRLQAIQRQIDNENKAYEKSEARAQERYDREVKAADAAHDKQIASYEAMERKIEDARNKSIASATAAYEKQVDALKAKWSDVQLGISPAVTQTIQRMSKTDLLELADSIGNVTYFSKEQILAAETVAERYDTIGKETMPQLLQASSDYAAFIGGDLRDTTETMARVMQDPITNMRLLRGLHIDLTAEEKAQIKVMQEHNDTAGVQALILGKVEGSVKGMAATMRDTASGQMRVLGNQFGELGAQIGTALLPMIKDVNAWLIKTLQDPNTKAFLQDMGNYLRDFGEELQKAIIDHKPELDAFIAQVGEIAKAFQKAFVEYGPKIQAFVAGLMNLLGDAQRGFAATGGSANDLGTRFGDLMRSIQEGMARLSDATNVWLTAIQGFWQDHGDQILGIVTFVWNLISDNVQTAMDLLGGILNLALDLLTGNWDQFGKDLRNMSDELWTDLQKVWGDGIGQIVAKAEELLLDIARPFADMIRNAIGWGGAVVDGLIKGITDKAGELQQMLDQFIQSNITDRFNLQLLIHSPSEVMADMGRNIAAGLQQGMLSGAGGVAGASNQMAGAVVGGASHVTNNNFNWHAEYGGGGNDPSYDFNVLKALASV